MDTEAGTPGGERKKMTKIQKLTLKVVSEFWPIGEYRVAQHIYGKRFDNPASRGGFVRYVLAALRSLEPFVKSYTTQRGSVVWFLTPEGETWIVGDPDRHDAEQMDESYLFVTLGDKS